MGAGHAVYDFRHAGDEGAGLTWDGFGPGWKNWAPEIFLSDLEKLEARLSYQLDREALGWGDTCVLLLPCGRSAHLEAGYAAGQEKRVMVVLPSAGGFRPELMYLLAERIVIGVEGLLMALR